MSFRLRSSRRNKPQNEVWIDKNMIHVSNPPIKRILIDRYQNYLNQIHSLKSQVEFYEIQDEPAYETWLRKNFSKSLEKILENKKLLSEIQDRLSEAELIALRYGISLSEAYKKVLEKANALLEKEKEDEENEEDSIKEPECEEDGRLKSSKKNTTAHKPLKDLYRVLARKLHPDMRSEDHPFWDDLWLEAQLAYQTNNIEDLRRLSLILEAHETVHSDHPHLSIVLKVNLVFEKQIHDLQDQISVMQKNPAWEFSKKESSVDALKGLMIETKKRLSEELSEIESELKNHRKMEKEYTPETKKLSVKKSRLEDSFSTSPRRAPSKKKRVRA